VRNLQKDIDLPYLETLYFPAEYSQTPDFRLSGLLVRGPFFFVLLLLSCSHAILIADASVFDDHNRCC
jgi:hypothetical protein